MDFRRIKPVILVLAVWVAFGRLGRGSTGYRGRDSIFGKLNPFHPSDPSGPVHCLAALQTARLPRRGIAGRRAGRGQAARCLQPGPADPVSATTSKRDEAMSANFHLVLAARINRLDAATTTADDDRPRPPLPQVQPITPTSDPTRVQGRSWPCLPIRPFATGGTSSLVPRSPPTSTFGRSAAEPPLTSPTPCAAANTRRSGAGC